MSYQPADVSESLKDATVSQLPTQIGDEPLVVGWRLGFQMASLGTGETTVLALFSQNVPLVRSFFEELVKDV